MEFREVEDSGRSAPGSQYRVFAEEPRPSPRCWRVGWGNSCARIRGFYLEIRDNALLAFRPEREFEEPEEALQWVAALAEVLRAPAAAAIP